MEHTVRVEPFNQIQIPLGRGDMEKGFLVVLGWAFDEIRTVRFDFSAGSINSVLPYTLFDFLGIASASGSEHRRSVFLAFLLKRPRSFFRRLARRFSFGLLSRNLVLLAFLSIYSF